MRHNRASFWIRHPENRGGGHGERPMSNAHVPSSLPPASFANGQLFFFELYSHFNVQTGTQPSIRVKCKYKRAWLSLALCEGCSHGGTSELALSWMGRVEESGVALARAHLGAWLVA